MGPLMETATVYPVEELSGQDNGLTASVFLYEHAASTVLLLHSTSGALIPHTVNCDAFVKFHLSDYINSHTDRFLAAENMRIYHTPLHDQKVGVWCAVSAHHIIGRIFFHPTVNLERYISNILNPFVAALTEKEKTHNSNKMVQLSTHPAEENHGSHLSNLHS
ncbi:hypothetical protein TNCV_3201561 [Trichonephila clavipes]|nr:hypothetical protein TNCV_3201561 [Trichonephila clavipes]